MQWHEDFKYRRSAYHVPQKDITKLAGISPTYLSDIERGKKAASDKLKALLDQTVELFNPKFQLYAVFDYIRIRFPTHDCKTLIEEVLKLRFSVFMHVPFGHYGYVVHYVFGDLSVEVSEETDERGTLFEFKGKGCRFLEEILLTQGRSWHAFFNDCLSHEGVFKRVDIAINDTAGILSIPELSKKANTPACKTIFQAFENVQSGEVSKQEILDGKLGMGHTLYLGSKKSDIYFCIYEKDYEQYKKEGVPIEDAEVKNRFEIRLKNDRALNALLDIMEYNDIQKTAFEIINNYVAFLEADEQKELKDWEIDLRWQIFLNGCESRLKLTMQPEPYTLDKTYRWIHEQVGPSLAMLKKMDKLHHTNYVEEVENIELPRKQQKILAQYSANIEEALLSEAMRGGIPKKDIKKPVKKMSFPAQVYAYEAKLKKREERIKELQRQNQLLLQKMKQKGS